MGVPSGVIGLRPDQNNRLSSVAARKEIGHGVFERAARASQIIGVAGDFRHAADTDAVAQSRDGDFIGFVHYR